MNGMTALLVALAMVPAIPLGRLRKLRLVGLMPHRALGAILSVAGAAPLAITGQPLLATLLLACFLACYGAGEAITRIGAHLRGEARILPTCVSRIVGARQRSVWLCRVAMVLLGLGCLLAGPENPASTVAAVAAAVAMATIAAIGISLAFGAFRKRQTMSDSIHAAEIERLLCWADKEGVRDLIHVPDGDAATIRKVEALLHQLQKQGNKAALICRGRKAFGKLRGKHTASWLVRTAQDLDDILVPPFQRCIHLDIGTNSTHVVGLRKLRQVLVDQGGRLDGAQEVPKDLRMFDEIRLRKDWGSGFAHDAQLYGISLQKIDPEKSLPVLPALPIGPTLCAGILVPAGPSGEDDFSSLAPAFELATALRRKCGRGRLIIGFEAGSAASRKLMAEWLTPSFGADLHIASSPTAVINAAPYLIWTPALDRVLPTFAKRVILRDIEDLATVDFQVEAA